MVEFRFASVLVAAGATLALATPSSALISLHLPGSGFYHAGGGGGGMHMMPKPAPAPKPVHMGGGGMGYGGGMGGSHMSGGYGGHTSGCCQMSHGGKPPLGMHPMGMHFYGMGGGSLKYGKAYGGHGYGMGWAMKPGYGGHPYGAWGSHGYDMGGAYGTGSSHLPLGTHMMGMHYYGMGGGSLAWKFGHLEHGYSPMHMQASWGTGTGTPTTPTYGGGQPTPPISHPYGPGPVMPPKTWGPHVAHHPYGPGSMMASKHWGGSSGYHYAAHYSYHVKYAYHVWYGSKSSHKPSSGSPGQWGPSKSPSEWTYAVD